MMNTIREIEKTIAGLPAEALAEFRAWFEVFDAGNWDEQFEQDVKAGRLDRLAAAALDEFKQGNCKEL